MKWPPRKNHRSADIVHLGMPPAVLMVHLGIGQSFAIGVRTTVGATR
jgi:hypothetical protein